MSVVTNVMITGLFSEAQNEDVSNHLKKFTKDTLEFMHVDGCKVGGEKCLEADVYIGAFNYMDFELFCDIILELDTFLDDYVFECIQVMLKKQDDDVWSIYNASELSIDCF